MCKLLNTTVTMLFTNTKSTLNMNVTKRTTSNIIARSPDGFTGILVVRLLPNARKLCNLLIKFVALSGVNVLNNNKMRIDIRSKLVVLTTYLPVNVIKLVSNVTRNGATTTSVKVMTGGPRRFNGTVLFPTVIRACTVLTLLVSFLTMDNVRLWRVGGGRDIRVDKLSGVGTRVVTRTRRGTGRVLTRTRTRTSSVVKRTGMRTRGSTQGVVTRTRTETRSSIGHLTSSSSVEGHGTMLRTGRRIVERILRSTCGTIKRLSSTTCFTVLRGILRGCMLPRTKAVYFARGSEGHVPRKCVRGMCRATGGGNKDLRLARAIPRKVSKKFVLACNNVRRGYAVGTLFSTEERRLSSGIGQRLFATI